MQLNKTATKISFTKQEMKGILRNLREIFGLLKDEKNWIQGDYKKSTLQSVSPSEVEKIVQMCLIGAVRDVDGPDEANTHVFMAFNLPEMFREDFLRHLKENLNLRIEDDLYYDDDFDGLSFSKKLARLCKDTINSLVYDSVDDNVEEFNDASSTTHATIVSYLKRLIKKAEKLS